MICGFVGRGSGRLLDCGLPVLAVADTSSAPWGHELLEALQQLVRRSGQPLCRALRERRAFAAQWAEGTVARGMGRSREAGPEWRQRLRAVGDELLRRVIQGA